MLTVDGMLGLKRNMKNSSAESGVASVKRKVKVILKHSFSIGVHDLNDLSTKNEHQSLRGLRVMNLTARADVMDTQMDRLMDKWMKVGLLYLTIKILKIQDTQKIAVITLKFEHDCFTIK